MPADALSVTFYIKPSYDGIDEEGGESVIATLIDGEATYQDPNHPGVDFPYYYITSQPGADSATVTIWDTTPPPPTPPTISISDAPSVTEGNSGETIMTFTVTLSAPTSETVTVNYAVADGNNADASLNATAADNDYVPDSQTLTFSPTVTSQTVNVRINGDVKWEKNEQLRVLLSSPVNATIADGLGIGTILDDEDSVANGTPISDVTCACVTCGDDESLHKGDNALHEEHLNYHGIANPHPIITFEAQLASGAATGTLTWFDVTVRLLNPGGSDVISETRRYAATGLSPGAALRFAQQVDASSLPTSRYQWELTVASIFSDRATSVQKFTGYEAVINRREDLGNPYGDGWWVNGLDQVHNSPGVGVLLVNDNAAASFFTENPPNPDGSVTYSLGAQHYRLIASFVRNADSTYTLTYVDGDKSHFDADGKLTSQVDHFNNTTRYDYDPVTEKLTAVVDLSSGRQTTYRYGASGMLASVTDFAARVTNFQHSGDKLVSITGPAPELGALRPVVNYAYVPSGTAQAGLLQTVTDELNHPTSFTYGSDRRLQSSTQVDTDGEGTFTTELTSIQSAGMSSSSPLRSGQRQGRSTDEFGRDTLFQTDRFGNVTYSTLENNETWNTHDSLGRLLESRMDPDGPSGPRGEERTLYNYDSFYLDKVTQVRYVVGLVDGQGNTETNDIVESWAFGLLGQATEHVDAEGRKTVYQLDSFGNVLTETQLGDPATTADDLRTTFTYTAGDVAGVPAGMISSVTDPAGATIFYVYYRAADGAHRAGQVKQIIHPAATIVEQTPGTAVPPVDDGAAGYTTPTGAWAEATSSYGHGGDYDYSLGGQGQTAVWTFTVPSTGRYRVSATWANSPSFATNAPFTILDGTSPRDRVLVNQRMAPNDVSMDGSAWEHLAVVNITGNSLVVRLATDGIDGYVIADAVRIEWIGDLPAGPEIIVLDGDRNIADASGSASFGSVAVGQPATKTFTIVNTGQQPLSLTGAFTLPAGFTLTSGFGATSLSTSQSVSFTVRLDAAAIGSYSGWISFETNDPDNGRFDFALRGTVLPAAVEIIDDDTDLLDQRFHAPGWQTFSTPNGYSGDWQYSLAAPGSGTKFATWTFAVAPGQYRVSANWFASTYYASNAPFTILDGTAQVAAEAINQQVPPDDVIAGGTGWEDIGGIVTITGNTLVVQVSDLASSWVIADAVRIERISLAAEPPLRAEERLDYDSAGNMVSHVDELGRTTTSRFDSHNRLVQTILPDPDGFGPLPSPSTANFYDAAGNLVRTIGADGIETRYENFNSLDQAQTVRVGTNTADEVEMRFVYDRQGRMVSQTQVMDAGEGGDRVTLWAYDPVAHTTTVTMPGSPAPIYVYRYDLAGNLLAVQEPGDVTAADETTFQYDRMNRQIAMLQPNPAGGAALTTTTAYDKTGNRTQMVDALLRTTSWQFDRFGRMVQMTLPDVDDGGPLPPPVYDYGYDANSNLVTTTAPSADGEVGSPRAVTRNVYDARSRLIQTTLGLGTADEATRRYAFDAAGQMVAETVDLDNTPGLTRRTLHQLDALGRVVRTTQSDPDAIGSGAAAPVWTFSYNAAGDLASETSPLNQGTANSTFLTYDGHHRLLTRTDAAPNGVSGQPVTTFEYNDAGEVTRMRDPLNHGLENWAVFTYDTLGRKTIEQSPEAAPGQAGPLTYFIYDIRSRLANVRQVVGLPDPENSETDDLVTYHGYDKLDRHTAEQDPQGGLTLMTYDAVGNMQTLRDPVGNFTTWEYNGLNQLKKETNQLTKFRSFEHDRLGNLVKEVDRENRTRTFSYDTLSRRTAENWLDAQLNTIRTISYAYNDAGELISASDPTSAYAHTYDRLGRMLTVDNQNTPGVPRVILTQQYDLNGNRTQLDATINGTADLRNSYVYDKLSRMTQLSQKGNGGNAVADKLVNFSYNAAGQFTDINRFKDLAATQEVASAHHGYDSLGRLKDLSYQRGGTDLFTPYAWTHDRVNRVTSFVSRDGTNNYLYNKNSELTSANLTNEAYAYDANGNRTGGGYSAPGANNQLLNDGTFTYTYDHEGNRKTRTRIATAQADDYITEFSWDHRNRLTRVVFKNNSGGETKVLTYSYDVFDRRIERQLDTTSPFNLADAAIERYVHDGDDVLFDFADPDGDSTQPLTHAKRYLQGAAVDQILAQEDLTKSLTDPDRVLSHLVDNIGTVRALANSAGAVVEHLQYDSFGNVVASSAYTRYQFTGREFEIATGLQYNRARWYDPAVGRWISEDPIGFASGDANLSAYVGNSSTNTIDPFGLADYKLGTDDPTIMSDPGAGAWASKPWTWRLFFLRQYIIDKLGLVWAGYPDAANHLRHYLGNSGKDHTIRLQKMIDDVPSAKRVYYQELDLGKAFVESLPDGTHQITSGRASGGYNDKDESWNWFYAVGGYSAWGKGTATVDVCADEYTLQFEYKVRDRYNWDGDKSVTILGVTVTDKQMAEFHLQGLGKEFDMYGSVKKTMKWTKGHAPIITDGW